LEKNTDGRNCVQHACCGTFVAVNDKLICTWQIQSFDPVGTPSAEEVVQVHKIGRDGLVSCHVGYLPKRLFVKYGAKRFDLMYLRVTDDLRTSVNSHERSRSKRYYGVVNCQIIRDNERYNNRNPFEGEPCDVSIEGTTSAVISREEDGLASKKRKANMEPKEKEP
jgi:hypothetical protein